MEEFAHQVRALWRNSELEHQQRRRDGEDAVAESLKAVRPHADSVRTNRRLRGALGEGTLCDLTHKTTEPAQRHPAEKRARLLAAARTLFGQIGYGASVHQICRAAGVGIGTFYHQFADKADLMRHLMSEENDFRVRAFDAIAADRKDNVAGEIARVLAGSDPALLRAMIEACGIDPQLRDFGRGLRTKTQERLGAALARIREARGSRPALDASAAAAAALVLGDAEIGRTPGPEIRRVIDVLVFAEGDDRVRVPTPA